MWMGTHCGILRSHSACSLKLRYHSASSLCALQRLFRECFSMRYHSASSMLCAVPALLASSLYHDLVADCACMFLKG